MSNNQTKPTTIETLQRIAADHGFKSELSKLRGITVWVPFTRETDAGMIRGYEGFENIKTIAHLREVLGY